ncbi:MAG: four helix bundle protein [Clostridia bacterium]|nr:four helix bundle protein [Clostridia bacterium]
MSIAGDKSKEFAIRIVRLYRYLCKEKREFVLSKQLLRSGTSIGANLAESECAVSRSDFLSKIYIALKETSETKYWLELLFKTGFLTREQFESVYKDAEELSKMLSATTRTMKTTK